MKDAKAGILLIGAKPEKEEEPKEKAGKGSLSATKALMAALDKGDAEAADEALRLHYEICSMGDDYEE